MYFFIVADWGERGDPLCSRRGEERAFLLPVPSARGEEGKTFPSCQYLSRTPYADHMQVMASTKGRTWGAEIKLFNTDSIFTTGRGQNVKLV